MLKSHIIFKLQQCEILYCSELIANSYFLQKTFYSLFHMKITASVTNSASRSWPVLFTHTYFYLLQTLLFCCKIKNCDRCFPQPIRSQTTVQLYILLDYFRVRICFNMNNKRHTLPIVYTTLNFNHCCFTKIKQSTW